MKTSFFSRFPREVMYSKRRRLVKNREEFLYYLKTKAPRTNFYVTVYSFREYNEGVGRPAPNYTTANVNKVYWDLDGETCWDNLQKLWTWCETHNIKRTVVFSGGGYHLYMLTLPATKSAVRNFQLYLTDKLGLDIDSKHRGMFGDLARVSRVVDTKNFNRGRWCICLKPEEVTRPFSYHCSIADKPRGLPFSFKGDNLLDISIFAEAEVEFTKPPEFELPDADADVVDNIDFNSLEPCISALIRTKQKKWVRKNGYVERRILINYARERLGLTLTQCVEFMRRVLTTAEFYHMLEEVPNLKYGQVEYLYRRADVFLPNCNTLKAWGICSKDCRR